MKHLLETFNKSGTPTALRRSTHFLC